MRFALRWEGVQHVDHVIRKLSTQTRLPLVSDRDQDGTRLICLSDEGEPTRDLEMIRVIQGIFEQEQRLIPQLRIWDPETKKWQDPIDLALRFYQEKTALQYQVTVTERMLGGWGAGHIS